MVCFFHTGGVTVRSHTCCCWYLSVHWKNDTEDVFADVKAAKLCQAINVLLKYSYMWLRNNTPSDEIEIRKYRCFCEQTDEY